MIVQNSLSFQVFSSGETSRTQDSSNCSVIKGATEAPRLVYVNEREQRKQNEPKVEKAKPRKLPRGKHFYIQFFSICSKLSLFTSQIFVLKSFHLLKTISKKNKDFFCICFVSLLCLSSLRILSFDDFV